MNSSLVLQNSTTTRNETSSPAGFVVVETNTSSHSGFTILPYNPAPFSDANTTNVSSLITALGEIGLRFSLLHPEILPVNFTSVHVEAVSNVVSELLCLHGSVEVADPVQSNDPGTRIEYNFVCQDYSDKTVSQPGNMNQIGSHEQGHVAIVGSEPVNATVSNQHIDPFSFFLWEVHYSVWDIGADFWNYVPSEAGTDQTSIVIGNDGFENVFVHSAVKKINDVVQNNLDKLIDQGVMDRKLHSSLPGFYASVVGKEPMTFSRLVFPVNNVSEMHRKFEPESNFLQDFGLGLFLVHTVSMVVISLLGRRRQKQKVQDSTDTRSNQHHNEDGGCLNTQKVRCNWL